MRAPASTAVPRPQPAAQSLRALAADLLERLETSWDAWFGARANPWRHLGALGFLMFWLAAATGAYLYAVYDTSVAGSYSSVARLSTEQPWLGGLMRSLHRYASDAFVLLMLLHLARELVYGRFHGFRWFTWLSGVPLLWLALGAGVVGFWLAWDELAQFSAVATMEWLDALPVFGAQLTRNFLTPASVDDRFFSLLAFLHIGLPLLLLLGMWVHVQRLSRPDTRPAASLAWGSAIALVALSLLVPVISVARADLSHVPQVLSLDWFYLAPHAIMYASSPVTLWVLAGVGTLLLAACPLLPHARRAPAAKVDAANCNGCGRCFADCPYDAIRMHPHPHGKAGAEIAVVDEALCAACGVCAGACPSATPFRSVAALVSGIDMPQLPIGQLRARLKAQLARLGGELKMPTIATIPTIPQIPRIVVFGCEHGADVRALQGPATAILSLTCTGQLPPAFVDYALRSGADAVLVSACPDGGCEFRLGSRWTAERLHGQREPHLRRTVAAGEWQLVEAGRHQLARVEQALQGLRAGLQREADVNAAGEEAQSHG
jgi:ferredoxin